MLIVYSSNLTFTLEPGWAFVETEDWRKDLEASWTLVESDDGKSSRTSSGINFLTGCFKMAGSILMTHGWILRLHPWTNGNPLE